MNRLCDLFLAIVACLLLTCSTEQPAAALAPDQIALGNHSFPVSTKNPQAQNAFNRGLILAYSFNHQLAEKEFRRAAALDPSSAMPWWGVALVNGPHINFPLMPEDKVKTAWTALEEAKRLSANASALERELIKALEVRYALPQPPDRSILDQRYAEAMKEVWDKHPENADLASLYAEALMDLHPWDLYTPDGQPKSWTPEITATLRKALELNIKHPLANHLYIHAMEASTSPGEAMPSADRLGALVPGAGHMLHMPAHIYIRTARFEDSATANEKAIAADKRVKESTPELGFYGLYVMHNYHFLAFTRMMQGQKAAALNAARAMVAAAPAEFLEKHTGLADGYMAMPIEVMVRFGDWESVLAEPEPQAKYPLSRALWHFSRTAALNAQDRPEGARAELEKFRAAGVTLPPDYTFGNNKADKLLELADLVAQGEIAARTGKYEQAVPLLRKAVSIEDSLRYDEPPDWIIPVRHTLGATLLLAGKLGEAEAVYREDLKKFPGNGWSLHGLSRALHLQEKHAEAAAAEEEFQRQWKNSDTKISSSCACQHGA